MAAVGRSLMAAIAAVVRPDGPLAGWSPADDPAEIVTDLYEMLIEARSAGAGRGAPAGCLRVPIKAGDDLGGGLVAVPRERLDRVFDAQSRFETAVPTHEPDPVTVAISEMRASISAAKGEE